MFYYRYLVHILKNVTYVYILTENTMFDQIIFRQCCPRQKRDTECVRCYY